MADETRSGQMTATGIAQQIGTYLEERDDFARADVKEIEPDLASIALTTQGGQTFVLTVRSDGAVNEMSED